RSARAFLFSFLRATATTDLYTLSLHDALPICLARGGELGGDGRDAAALDPYVAGGVEPRLGVEHVAAREDDIVLLAAEPGVRYRDRKSTRLNSSHVAISYAVFCLKKKKRDMDE